MKQFFLVASLLFGLNLKAQRVDIMAGFPCSFSKGHYGLFDLNVQSTFIQLNQYQSLGIQVKYASLKTNDKPQSILAPALHLHVFELIFGPASRIFVNLSPGYYFGSNSQNGFSLNYGLTWTRGIRSKVRLLVHVMHHHFFGAHIQYLGVGSGISFRL